MTPQGMMGGMLGPPAANSNLYNKVSSSGMAAREDQASSDQQPQMDSLVEKATTRFGAVFNSFTSLVESYPGSDKEAEAVKNALANWLNSVVNRINENSGNSTY